MRVDVKRKNFPVLPCRGSYLSCIQPHFGESTAGGWVHISWA
jgi:hypothetical protein